MQAFKYHSVVKEDGIVEIPKIPFKKGQKVEVIIFPEDEEEINLMEASESSLKFWDNPEDNEVWNNV